MRTQLLVLAMLLDLALAPALAQSLSHSMVAESEDGHLRVEIFETACESEAAVRHVQDEFKPSLRHAGVFVDGQLVRACWFMDAKRVFVIQEGGKYGAVPLEAFGAPEPRK